MRMSRKRRKARERRQKVNSIFKGIGTSGAGFTLASLLLLNPFAAPVAHALPTGGEIAAGQAAIAQAGTAMTIQQQTAQAIINWQSFNIAANESVHFQQPGADAVALNRVLGNDPSAIFGSLTANGHVFLVNPNGVFFAPGAQVDVGGLTASTLNITDADFLARNYRFTNDGAAGSVINQGELTAKEGGLIMLLGPEAVNEGVIVAKKGTAALAAGDAVTFDYYGDGKISLTVDEGAARAVAENKGLIEADGGMVVMTARANQELTSSVINQSGIIRASSLDGQGGEVRLDAGQGSVNIDGQIAADGLAGGLVTVSGKAITLDEGAAIDVSGVNGGGTAYIGGQWQGSGDMAHADSVTIKDGASINADATEQGDGGTVVVWSDGTTNFAGGTISAKGGALSGNGGKVETSGHTLNVQGNVNASAANGQGGEWLLDPTDITIVESGSDVFAPAGDSSTVGADKIASTLNNGTSVTITTGGSDNGNGTGNITVNAAINKTAGSDAKLTLDAYAAITVNSNITSTAGKLDVEMKSGQATANDGSIKIADTSTIATNGGSVLLHGQGTGDKAYTQGTGTNNGIDIAGSINTTGGNIELWGSGANGNGVAVSGSLDAGTGTVDIHAVSNTGTALAVKDSGSINAENVTLTADTIRIEGSGAVTGNTNGAVTLSTVTDNKNISFSSNTGDSSVFGIDKFKNFANLNINSGSGKIIAGASSFDSSIGKVTLETTGDIEIISSLAANGQELELKANNIYGSGYITTNWLDLESNSFAINSNNSIQCLTGTVANDIVLKNNQSLTIGNTEKDLTSTNGKIDITTVNGSSGASAITVANALTAKTTVKLSSVDAININAAVSGTDGVELQTGAAKTLALGENANIAGKDVTVKAGALTTATGASMTGTGTLTLQNAAVNGTVTVGNTGSGLVVKAAEFAAGGILNGNFADVVIGSKDTGTVEVNDTAVLNNGNLNVQGADIAFGTDGGLQTANGNLLLNGKDSISFAGSNALSAGGKTLALNTNTLTGLANADFTGNSNGNLLISAVSDNRNVVIGGNAEPAASLTVTSAGMDKINEGQFANVQIGSKTGEVTLNSFTVPSSLTVTGGAATLAADANITGADSKLALNVSSLSQADTNSKINVGSLALNGTGAFDLSKNTHLITNIAGNVGSLNLNNNSTNIGKITFNVISADGKVTQSTLNGLTTADKGAVTLLTNALTAATGVDVGSFSNVTIQKISVGDISVGENKAGALNMANALFAASGVFGGADKITLGGTDYNGNIFLKDTEFAGALEAFLQKSNGNAVSLSGTVTVNGQDMWVTAWAFAMPSGTKLNVTNLHLDIASGLQSANLAGQINGTGTLEIAGPASGDIYISDATNHTDNYVIAYTVLNGVMDGFSGFEIKGKEDIIMEDGTLNKGVRLVTDGSEGSGKGNIKINGAVVMDGSDIAVQLDGKKLAMAAGSSITMAGTGNSVDIKAAETELGSAAKIDVGEGSFTLSTDKLIDNTANAGTANITGTGDLKIQQLSDNVAMNITSSGTADGLSITNRQLNGELFGSSFKSLTLGNDAKQATVTVDGVTINNNVTIQTGKSGEINIGAGDLAVGDGKKVILRGGKINATTDKNITVGNGSEIAFYTNDLTGLNGAETVNVHGSTAALGISSYDGSIAISLGTSHGGLVLGNDLFTGDNSVFSQSFTDYNIGSANQQQIYVDGVNLTKNLSLTGQKIDFLGDITLNDGVVDKDLTIVATGAVTQNGYTNNVAGKLVDTPNASGIIQVGNLTLNGGGEYNLNSVANKISGTLNADATRVNVASNSLNIGQINGNGGAIILSADKMTFAEGAELKSEDGLLTLQQATATTDMQIGGSQGEFTGLYLSGDIFNGKIVKEGFTEGVYLGRIDGTRAKNGDEIIGTGVSVVGTLNFLDDTYIRSAGDDGYINMWADSQIITNGNGITIQSDYLNSGSGSGINAGNSKTDSNITISTNGMNLDDNMVITGAGNLTLETWSKENTICFWLGGEGPGSGEGLWIKQTYFDSGTNSVFKPGFDKIILGNEDAKGALIQKGSVAFQDNVEILQGKNGGAGFEVESNSENPTVINSNNKDYSISSQTTKLNNVEVDVGKGKISINSDYLELTLTKFFGKGGLAIDTFTPDKSIIIGGSGSELHLNTGWFAADGAFGGVSGGITLGSETNTGGIIIGDKLSTNQSLNLITSGSITDASGGGITLTGDAANSKLTMQGSSIELDDAVLSGVNQLTATAGTGEVTVTNAANTITSLGNISGSGINIKSTGDLTVAGNVTSTGNANDVHITVADGDLTIGSAGKVTSGHDVYLTANSDNKHFFNKSGTDAIDAGNRWVVSSYDSVDDEYDGLTGDFRKYGTTSTNQLPADQSGSIHKHSPTALLSAEKTYGDNNENFFTNGSFSLTIDGDKDGGAERIAGDKEFLNGGKDFAILSGQKSPSSYTWGDNITANDGKYLQVNKNINGTGTNDTAYGTDQSDNSYKIGYLQDNNTLNYKIETKFWVKPKEVTVTAKNDTVDYSTLNGGSYQGTEILNGTFGNGVDFIGFVNGETINSASGKTGSVQYTGSSQTAAAPGDFVIGLNGNLKANNYIFTYQNGTLTITDTNGAYVPPVTPEPSLPNGSDAALSTSGDAAQVTQQNVNTVLQPPNDSINTLPTNGYEGSMGSDMPTNLNDNLAKLPVNTDNVYGAFDSAAAETMPQGDVTVQFDGADREYSFTADRNGFGFELVGQSPLGGYQTSKTDGAVPVVFTDYDSNGQTVTQALDGFYDISYNAERLNIKPQAQGSAIPELSEISPELKQSFKVDYNGNEGEFTVSYGNGIITVEPINDAAAEMVGDGDNKKCQAIVATSILRSVQDLAVMPDQVRAVYVYKSKRPLRTYAVRMG